MKCKLYILFLTVVCLFGSIPKSHAQSPPLRQCIGSVSRFAVTSNENSTFEYSITGGRFLSTARPDSLVVEWGMDEGLFRIGVRETARFSNAAREELRKLGIDEDIVGCQGEWIYMLVDLKGARFVPDRPVYLISPGETIQIAIDANVYNSIRWTDTTGVIPDADGRPGIFHFTRPGNFEIFLEDTHGCKHRETVIVNPRP